MDFFALQDDARRRTGLLLVYYLLAVAGIIAGIYLALAALLAYDSESARALSAGWFWDPLLLAWVAIITVLIIGVGTLFKTLQLRQGGAKVAKMLGGRKISPSTDDPNERRLLNIVEEMAIAAGISVPDVYLLDNEPGINAFAAGFSPADAVVGVTAGMLKTLSRDELQGVIGHEFSHIIHGDMRLNIRLMGVLHGILLIAVTGYVLMRGAAFSGSGRRSSRGNRGNGAIIILVVGLAAMVIGYIGVFFANLIKSAVSRQREYLADAAAVQFTRNPGGIAGALKRIAGLPQGARVRDVHASEASHLFFGNALRAPWLELLATHPPLSRRISRLDPAFNPALAAMVKEPSGTATDSLTAGLSPGMAAEQIAGGTGNLKAENLAAARNIIGTIPENLIGAVRRTESAKALVFALLLGKKTETRREQLEIIIAGHSVSPDSIENFAAKLEKLASTQRLTLAELAAPALRRMPEEDYAGFKKTVRGLIGVDNNVSPFEYALHRLLLRHLEPAFGKVDPAYVRYRDIKSIIVPATEVMFALASWGCDNEADARRSFTAGMNELTNGQIPYPSHRTSIGRVNRALEKLSRSAPGLKRRLVAACAACVTADGRLGPDQGELLRAIADSLDCPVPPLPLPQSTPNG